jgi:uncharacterized protein
VGPGQGGVEFRSRRWLKEELVVGLAEACLQYFEDLARQGGGPWSSTGTRIRPKKNRRKHKVDFDTAIKVLHDPEVEDDVVRYNVIGIVEGRMLHVTFTMRDKVHRIISARLAERHEKRRYDEG